MEFVDYSPSPAPSPDEQRDALQKGLGRVMQWAMDGKLDDDHLLQSCLCDQRHDAQVEDLRGRWLWRIIQSVNGAVRFRGPLLNALAELSDIRSADQLCELAYFYAAIGDKAFHDRLYEIVKRKPVSDYSRLGEEEILRLDKERAFLFSAGVRGVQLLSRDWDWDDECLIDDGVEQIGEAELFHLLEDTTDESVQRFRESWLREKKRKGAQTVRHTGPVALEAMKTIKASDIIAEAEKERPALGMLRGWGMHATDGDLRLVSQALWSAEKPRFITHLLRIFSNRSLPEFDPRLLDYCQHVDGEVRHWAFNATTMNCHPAVREFAIANMEAGIQDKFGVCLFIRNYTKGDEARILKALELPRDVNELHWLLMDVIKVLENNSEADCSRLAVIAYACTPCQNCRFDAARLLNSQQAAPTWLSKECLDDASEECRDVFKDVSSTPGRQ